jgi:hypothetical protein
MYYMLCKAQLKKKEMRNMQTEITRMKIKTLEYPLVLQSIFGNRQIGLKRIGNKVYAKF